MANQDRGRNRGIEETISQHEEIEYKLITVQDYFLEYLFPDAIIYGMSYDEFWNKDPQLFFSYRFSYLKRIDIDKDKMNYNAWLNGLYVLEAQDVILANSFGKEKKSYPTKPHDFSGKEEKKVVKTEKEFIENRHFWARFKERRNS